MNVYYKIKELKTLLIICVLAVLISCSEVSSNDENNMNVTEKVEISQKLSEKDMGKLPWVVDIEDATIENSDYRNVVWTGEYLQLVYMSLKVGEIIDLELHNDHDQFVRIEKGEARVLMGKTKENLDFDKKVSDDWAILIPAGYWHEIRNIGDSELKLYTIYGPPEHPKGTVNRTYKDAKEQDDN